MKPDWNIGKVARERLATMHKAGWDEHTFRHVPVATDPWWVELFNVRVNTVNEGSFEGFGNTIGLAVAEGYRQWKAHQQTRGNHEQ